MVHASFYLNFIPMILLYLVATYSSETAKWSHSILGKTIAVVIILMYASVDIVSGLLATAIVIFYYQTDYVEGFSHFLKEMYVKTDLTIIEIKDKETKPPPPPPKIQNHHFLSLEDAYPLDP